MTAALLNLAVEIAIRSTVVVAAILVILTCFRIHSGALRNAVWRAVLIAMLMLPVMLPFVPGIAVPTAAFRMPGPLVRDAPPLAELSSFDNASSLSGPVPAASASIELRGMPTPSAPRSPVPFSWRAAALSVYLVGALFLFTRLLLGLLYVSRIRRASRAIAGDADLFESSAVVSPVTIGLLRPRVVLPVNWREWPSDMRTAVLAHERAHTSRRDPLIAALARLNCAIYWFHPVAWWLAREVAITAEQACDDAAMTQVSRRQYAETLCDIAATVGRHRGRLAWRSVGMDGDGRLGERIDRVLSAASPMLTRKRQTLVVSACALAMVLAIACRQTVWAEPLREDPQLAAELQRQARLERIRLAAEQLSHDEAAALEELVERTPEDMAARETLVEFYIRPKQTWQERKGNVLKLRDQSLWLIQHHPESEVALRARVWQSNREDWEQSRELWLAAIASPDTSAQVLSNAADFFDPRDRPAAEQILLRGAQRYREILPIRQDGSYHRSWSTRLGRLYMSAMLGRSSGDAASQWARHQLEQSSDAAVLYAAGINLTRMAAGSHPRLASTENHLFGLEILERANRLDPNLAERAEARLTDRDAFKQAAFVTAGVGPRMLEVIDGFYPLAAFDGAPQKAWPDMLATSTGVQRLRRLAGFAQNEFATAERRDWMATQPSAGKDPSDRASQNENRLAAREMFARSKAYAREAIELGGSLKADAQTADALFRAHLAYGLNALREKDRTRAVEHLLAASMFRPATSVDSGDSLETKLVNYLLKNGERKAVIEYLERGAVRREKPARDEMLEAAAAIRAGMMPARYQRAVAFGHV